MKKATFTLGIIMCFMITTAQTFEKSFPYFGDAYGDLVFTQNDGYVIAGAGIKDGPKIYLIKTDLNGEVVWTKFLDYGLSGLGMFSSATDLEGNMYISFTMGSLANLVKFSPEGNEIWSKKYNNIMYEMQLYNEDELLVGGTETNTSANAVYLYRLDKFSGDLIRKSEPIQNSSLSKMRPTTLSVTESGIISMSISSSQWDEVMPLESTLYNFTPDGDTINSSTLQNPEQFVNWCTNAFGEELISIGRIPQYAITDSRSYLIRQLTDGTLISLKETIFPYREAALYDYIINDQNQIVALGEVVENSDAGFEILLYCMSMTGDSIWTRIIGTSDRSMGFDIKLCNDGGYIISGSIENDGINLPYLVKTNELGLIIPVGIEETTPSSALSVYPNPATDYVVFETQTPETGTIVLSDSYGKKLGETTVSASKKTLWNKGNLKPGVYMYRFTTEAGNSFSGTIMIVQK